MCSSSTQINQTRVTITVKMIPWITPYYHDFREDCSWTNHSIEKWSRNWSLNLVRLSTWLHPVFSRLQPWLQRHSWSTQYLNRLLSLLVTPYVVFSVPEKSTEREGYCCSSFSSPFNDKETLLVNLERLHTINWLDMRTKSFADDHERLGRVSRSFVSHSIVVLPSSSETS